jgi:transposase
VGIDDSKDVLALAVAESGRNGRVYSFGRIENSFEALKKAVRQLGGADRLSVAYESGPNGYTLYHQLSSLGVDCIVAAASKTPRKTGDRIKTDPRDARDLARLHRAGELTPIRVPDLLDEAMRDLVRGREGALETQRKARQRLSSLLLRRGRRYTAGRATWTQRHIEWLRAQSFEPRSLQVAFEESLLAVDVAQAAVARFDGHIETFVAEWRHRALVEALSCLRGLSLLGSATLVSELGTFEQFARPSQLMGFVGMVPSLMQTGSTRWTGPITKKGNAHVRRVLIEGAWAYTHAPRRSAHLQKRLEDQPRELQELSWRCQVRLCQRYRQLTYRGKHHNKVIVAIGRELLGYIWEAAHLHAALQRRAG